MLSVHGRAEISPDNKPTSHRREIQREMGFVGEIYAHTNVPAHTQLAGCAKVYPSRTEMLRELNTTGIPTHDALRRQKLQSLKRKTLTRLREVCFLRACLCS